jgi:hypothetical protein
MKIEMMTTHLTSALQKNMMDHYANKFSKGPLNNLRMVSQLNKRQQPTFKILLTYFFYILINHPTCLKHI